MEENKRLQCLHLKNFPCLSEAMTINLNLLVKGSLVPRKILPNRDEKKKNYRGFYDIECKNGKINGHARCSKGNLSKSSLWWTDPDEWEKACDLARDIF